jgi:hypothetical protein
VSELPSGAVEVLAGTAEPDLRWLVVADGDDAELSTMLEVYRGGRLVKKSGFGGPVLYDDALINEWRGRSDGLPYFVMARTLPIVDRVVATTDRGTEVVLALSPVIERWELRFAAAALPDGEGPASLRVESEGITLESTSQQTPRFRREQ